VKGRRRRRKRKVGRAVVPPAAAEHALALSILRQPDDTTCGPTCLHAVYRYLGDRVSLESVIEETPTLEEGGTLAVLLGSHALRRGYKATMYTYNLQVFDPTWFEAGAPPLAAKLQELAETRSVRKLRAEARAYVDYLALGGKICFEDLTSELLRRYLKRGVPILTGLSSTFLYRSARELPRTNESDDVHGYPAGHFVVLTGYREESREVRVADPWHPHSVERSRSYWVGMSRLVNSILLGIVTYDANLLIIEKTEPSERPRGKRAKDGHGAHPRRRQ
jgi:hypothetical protein